MNKLLEVQFSGWTATPRLPFILSGNAVCMHTPSYSLVLGIIGCCLGRNVAAEELRLGFKYSYDTTAKDLETRQRLEFDGKRVRTHQKGTDAYVREFHTTPKLTIWTDRLDWKNHFENPVGTPALGRSQDILTIEQVREIDAVEVPSGKISGCMLPFQTDLEVGGQLVQLAESYQENDEVGSGRTPVQSKVFISIPHDNEVEIALNDLYRCDDGESVFYLHKFGNG